MSDLADRLGRLPQEQRARLLDHLRRTTAPPEPAAVLARREHGPRSRASFQQEQMWFVDQLGGGLARNHVVLAVHLDGPLDRRALEQAVHALVDRHEVLHSRLVEVDGVPWQEPLLGHRQPITFTDLAGRADAGAEWDRLRAGDVEAPFDLAAEPPLRLRLVCFAEDRHVLLWVVHHIAWDPGSTRVLLEELTAAYRATAQGHGPRLDPLPVEYADFGAWQRERLNARRTEQLTAWWREQLGGVAGTELPPDLCRPAVPDGAGAALSLPVGAQVTARLAQLAHEHDTTVFAAQLAAFAALLHRWTGEDEITVGTAGAGRGHPDLAGLVGCFVTMIPLHTRLSGELTFREVLQRTRTVVLESFAHAELPFERMVEAVQPPRVPGRHPLFQIEFTAVGDWQQEARDVCGMGWRVEQLHDGGAKFDLSLVVAGTDELELSLEYATALYRPQTAQTLLRAYRAVLEQVTADPDVRIADLSLTDAAEADQLTTALSQGLPADEGALQATLDGEFRRQARATPSAPAVRDRDRSLDYAALDAWSDAVADAVVGAGAVPGAPVGVRLSRSATAVAALLGVLKAGCWYVPLDPSMPADRVADMISDAGIALVLVDPSEEAQPLPAGTHALPVIAAPAPLTPAPLTPAPAAPAEGGPIPGTASTPEGLAYVLFTSGSTGRPKGVMVEHRGVVHFARAIAEDYGIGVGERVLGFAPLTFDVSVFEVFATLLSGAELVLAADDERHDPALLTSLIERHGVTVAELPPALLPLLDPRRMPGLRLVSVGGEAVPGQLVEPWTAGGRRFVNGYGPTEATVAVTLFDCTGHWDRTPPIGRPMRGHQALVLDGRLRPLPVGVPGELCVAGPGVARGYLGLPELTADRFPPNPFAGGPCQDRLYRTGDLARRLPDGTLEFLGRTDRQVKVNGFRIELGEVEAVLTRHPQVARAVAAVVTGADGAPMLVGYLVADPHAPGLDLDDVRRHVHAYLPGYLVPVLVTLDDLPLTRHGKVDLGALPAPADAADAAADAAGLQVTGPRDDVEAFIADEVVAPLLGRTRVDVEADFFVCGGSSLQATTVVSRVRSHFGVDIVLADYFAEPTVARLAELVRRGRSSAARQEEQLAAIFEQVEQLSEEQAATMLRSIGGRVAGA